MRTYAYLYLHVYNVWLYVGVMTGNGDVLEGKLGAWVECLVGSLLGEHTHPALSLRLLGQLVSALLDATDGSRF